MSPTAPRPSVCFHTLTANLVQGPLGSIIHQKERTAVAPAVALWPVLPWAHGGTSIPGRLEFVNWCEATTAGLDAVLAALHRELPRAAAAATRRKSPTVRSHIEFALKCCCFFFGHVFITLAEIWGWVLKHTHGRSRLSTCCSRLKEWISLWQKSLSNMLRCQLCNCCRSERGRVAVNDRSTDAFDWLSNHSRRTSIGWRATPSRAWSWA